MKIKKEDLLDIAITVGFHPILDSDSKVRGFAKDGEGEISKKTFKKIAKAAIDHATGDRWQPLPMGNQPE